MATQWRVDDGELVRLAFLFESFLRGVGNLAAVSGEMRQIEDRHGMSPAARLRLRWVIDGEQPAPMAQNGGARVVPIGRGRRPRVDPRAG
ncbi:MAG: hypothetical protein IPM45_17965 [Acidimicrobiales bacterium]|nr:hypothetical protein [Acidimicrobiales bacterium]